MKKEYTVPQIRLHDYIIEDEELANLNLSGMTSRDDSGWTPWE